MGMTEMSKETHENLLAVDPQYVLDCNAHAERREQQMLEHIARDSIASGRENNAIGAIRLLAELTGFGVEQKR